MPQAWKLKLSNWEMVAMELLFSDRSIIEGDRISPLESYG